MYKERRMSRKGRKWYKERKKTKTETTIEFKYEKWKER
jgi:hypothetical protein